MALQYVENTLRLSDAWDSLAITPSDPQNPSTASNLLEVQVFWKQIYFLEKKDLRVIILLGNGNK